MVAFVNTFTAAVQANQAYLNSITAAENFISSHWTNSITLRVTWDAQARGTNGTFLATNSFNLIENISYSTLKNALIAHGSPASNFPATDPSGGVGWSLPIPYARMLGLTTQAPATDDTVILNTSYNWAYNGDVTAVLLHEVTEGGMGRIGELGKNTDTGGHTLWSTMDLFRYNAAHQHDYTDGLDGQTTFFSIDGGTTLSSLAYNNQYNAQGTRVNNGDTADFTQLDPFGTGNPGTNLTFSNTDFLVMSALGWTPTPQGNPAPPAATTADMILRHASDGQYYIYDIGNNSLLAAYKLGQVGTDWNFYGLGGFFGHDTTDMVLRNYSTGGIQIYDISNNNITGSAFLGTVGLDWLLMGYGNFSSFGETDMMLRRSSDGQLLVYDIRNNAIIGSNLMGKIGLDWQIGGYGNFSSRGTSDMIMRNTRTGGLEVYDINSNQITGAAFMGTVGLDWQIMGFGNFSSRAGVTDMVMRNTKTGGIEIYDINNNQITSAYFIGTVGLDWQFAGVGPIHAAGASDLVLRNANTGAFQVYDIAFNRLTGSASLGAVGLDWQLGGIAVDPPDPTGVASGSGAGVTGLPAAGGANNSSVQITLAPPTSLAVVDLTAPVVHPGTVSLTSASSGGGAGDVTQLVQAMAGFGAGSGATDTSSPAPLGAETSQQTLLTAPHHT
jgi:hypothetical protein